MGILIDPLDLQTAISNRAQRYFVRTGMESESKGQRTSLTAESVEGYKKHSNAKLFYGVRGIVKRGEYEMTEPGDCYQRTQARSSKRVPLQAPKDVESWIRKALEVAGITDFLSFPEFLQRNMDIALHFSLDPLTGLLIKGPAQQLPVQAPQALPSKAQPRKRAADGDAQAAPENNKKRRMEQTTRKKQAKASPSKESLSLAEIGEIMQFGHSLGVNLHGVDDWAKGLDALTRVSRGHQTLPPVAPAISSTDFPSTS